MSIWKKISDLAHKSLSDALDRLENKNTLREQALLDFAEQKQKANDLLIKAMAQARLMQQQLGMLSEKIDALTKEAQAFLQQHHEPKAKEILTEKQKLSQQFVWLEQELIKETDAIATIKQALSLLDEKISLYKSQSSVETSQDVLEREDAFQTFARMEEKIGSTEFAIEAFLELEKDKKDPKQISKMPFDTHSDPNAIEQELAELKKKLPKE